MCRSGIAGSYSNSIFSFLPIVFSTGAAPIHIPTNSVDGFLFINMITDSSLQLYYEK